jgi:acyl-coenzyme A synthetase/AMP-(fatty) acid ligase
MSYQITSLKGSGKDVVRRVMQAEDSQLLIPEKYEGRELHVDEPPENGKYIGLFSSGTSGTPRCIWNRYENLLKNAELTVELFETKPRHFLLMMALPWHVAGLSWALMAEYLNCEYMFITTRKGDHDLWIKTVQDTEPDYLLTVPAVLRALYDEEWFVNRVVFGGYPIRHSEYALLAPHCKLMYQGYGQTEAGGLISGYKRRSTVIPEPNENLCHGTPVAGAEINCEGSQEQPDTIYIKSPTAYTSGFYDSGDVGYKDGEGNINITGRKTDITDGISSGNKKSLLSG